MLKSVRYAFIFTLVFSFSFTSNLFFSEYAEGSSNHKYLEIYNASGADVDLSGYSLSSCSNGCNTMGEWDYPDNVTFTATLAADDVYVVCHGSADAAIQDECDQTFTYLSNGDDVFALTEVGTGLVLDVIGMVGLNYFDFNIMQGTDSYASHTILSISGEFVAILENTTAANINIPDFMPMPDDYLGDVSDTYEIFSNIGNTTDIVTTANFTASTYMWLSNSMSGELSQWLDGPVMKLHRKDIEDEVGIDLSLKDGHPGHKHKPDMDKGSYELRVEHTQETDGAIDIDDVMGVLALSRGIKQTSGKEHELAADWNGDGLIDIDDVMGVLVGGSGIGMSISANRNKWIRAALCCDRIFSELSRQHNNANVVVLPGQFIPNDMAYKIVRTFMDTRYDRANNERCLSLIDERFRPAWSS